MELVKLMRRSRTPWLVRFWILAVCELQGHTGLGFERDASNTKVKNERFLIMDK